MEEKKVNDDHRKFLKEKFEKIGKFHDKYYKFLFLIPLLLLIFSLVYMVHFYVNHGDFIYKDISLTGGTSITIYEKIDADALKKDLSDKLRDINTKKIYDLTTREHIGTIIETKTSPEEAKEILEEYLGYELNDKNSSFEFTGSTLSESFYKQLLIAILFSFAFMAIVVFFIFKNFVPSLAVILSAFSDILMSLVVINILGVKLSSAGIVAFLMIIGYSVDTDILLTNRLLKREGSLNRKIFGAFKTGMTMTLTSLLAIIFSFIIVKPYSTILNQIFLILIIGLSFDILNTWITNVSILKWHLKKNEA